MTADAVVVAARADGCVDLEFGPARQCAGCAGSCLWRRLQKARLNRLPASGAFEPGARVRVVLSARRLLTASLLLYGLPLAAILIGGAAGTLILRSDVGTLIGVLFGLAFVIASFGLIRERLERATLSGLDVTPRA